MDVRDKLVELLDDMQRSGMGYFGNAIENKKIADYLIKHGVTVQEWIPASEPPKDTYEYWIAYKAGGDYSYSTGYFNGKCWCSALTHHKIPVTHWMPMPNPPKGE